MSDSSTSTPSVTITKLIAAPREAVFAAWSTPELMSEWMGGGETDIRKVELDFTVGGKFLIDMWGEHEGKACGGDHKGEYLEINPPEKLVFTWISEYTADKPSVVTLEFLEKVGQTELRLTHSQLPTQEIADMHGQGWIDFADLLNQFIVAGATIALKAAYDNLKAKIKSKKETAAS